MAAPFDDNCSSAEMHSEHMESPPTVFCPVCQHGLDDNDRLVIENYNGSIVIWHVRNFEETKEDSLAKYDGWCGNNFGTVMPKMFGVATKECGHIHST